MNFYHSTNCSLPIFTPGVALTFLPYTTAPSVMGVLATDKPEEIAALDGLVKQPKSTVTAIDLSEYNRALKQKRVAHDSYAPTIMANTPTPGLAQRPPSAPVDTNPAGEPELPIVPLASTADALTVVKVEKKEKARK
jgi:hypothetical protein